MLTDLTTVRQARDTWSRAALRARFRAGRTNVNAVSFLSMKLPKLTAVIERENDWFVATCPELGVASQGRTIEEAEKMIKEAVEILLEDADEKEIECRLHSGLKFTYFESPKTLRRRILSAGEICDILQRRGWVRSQQSGSDIVMRKQTPAAAGR